MKIICLLATLACLGTGWSLDRAVGAPPEGRAVPEPCGPELCELIRSCDATVRPTGNGTCIVECEGPDGRTCRLEIACEEGCPVCCGDGEA